MYKRKVILPLLIGGLIAAVIYTVIAGRQPDTVRNAQASFKDITVQEFDEVLAKRDPFVIDVHVPEQEHLAGTDKFIDYRKVKVSLNEFPQDKSAEVIIYCRSGSMSKEAAQILADAGYTNVKNLIGGVIAYREAHQGILINPKTVDLGTVVYGTMAYTEFTLSNNTNTSLQITRVTTSCSCTKAEVLEKTLEPYQLTTVKVSFDPSVHKDDTDLGDVTRTIFIETDNINFPNLRAEITALVVKK